MAKKIRVGILLQALEGHRYLMSLHQNFDIYCKDGISVFFETIDADGKLKRVSCTVEQPGETDLAEYQGEEPVRALRCVQVYDVVRDTKAGLVSPPSQGKVVYLALQELDIS